MSIDLTKYKDKGLTGLANLGNTLLFKFLYANAFTLLSFK